MRVELKSLTEDDLRRVLSEKQYNLIKVEAMHIRFIFLCVLYLAMM